MKNKCEKYQQLFIFESEQDLLKHLEHCSDCKKQHQEMEKVASLVKETKPLFIKSEKKSLSIKYAAAIACLFLATFSINLLFTSPQEELISMIENSPITQMDLPVDDYGLLLIE